MLLRSLLSDKSLLSLDFSLGGSFSITRSLSIKPNNCKRLFPGSVTTTVPSLVISKPQGRFNCPNPSPSVPKLVI